MPNIRAIARDFFTRESVTVSTTSVGLTAAIYETDAATKGPAQYALLTTETDAIRARFDGGAADATSHLFPAGSSIELHGIETIRRFRAIRVTLDATVRASFAR